MDVHAIDIGVGIGVCILMSLINMKDDEVQRPGGGGGGIAV